MPSPEWSKELGPVMIAIGSVFWALVVAAVILYKHWDGLGERVKAITEALEHLRIQVDQRPSTTSTRLEEESRFASWTNQRAWKKIVLQLQRNVNFVDLYKIERARHLEALHNSYEPADWAPFSEPSAYSLPLAPRMPDSDPKGKAQGDPLDHSRRLATLHQQVDQVTRMFFEVSDVASQVRELRVLIQDHLEHHSDLDFTSNQMQEKLGLAISAEEVARVLEKVVVSSPALQPTPPPPGLPLQKMGSPEVVSLDKMDFGIQTEDFNVVLGCSNSTWSVELPIQETQLDLSAEFVKPVSTSVSMPDLGMSMKTATDLYAPSPRGTSPAPASIAPKSSTPLGDVTEPEMEDTEEETAKALEELYEKLHDESPAHWHEQVEEAKLDNPFADMDESQVDLYCAEVRHRADTNARDRRLGQKQCCQQTKWSSDPPCPVKPIQPPLSEISKILNYQPPAKSKDMSTDMTHNEVRSPTMVDSSCGMTAKNVPAPPEVDRFSLEELRARVNDSNDGRTCQVCQQWRKACRCKDGFQTLEMMVERIRRAEAKRCETEQQHAPPPTCPTTSTTPAPQARVEEEPARDPQQASPSSMPMSFGPPPTTPTAAASSATTADRVREAQEQAQESTPGARSSNQAMPAAIGGADNAGRAAAPWTQTAPAPPRNALSPRRSQSLVPPQRPLSPPLAEDAMPPHPRPEVVWYSAVRLEGMIECAHRHCLPYHNQHGNGWRCEWCHTKWFRRNNGETRETSGPSRYQRPDWRGFAGNARRR